MQLPHLRHGNTSNSRFRPISLGNFPPDPFDYRPCASQHSQYTSLTVVVGLDGVYRLSHYTDPTVRLVYVTAFLFACLADLFDAVANRNHWAHESYPDGKYECSHAYSFLQGQAVFALELTKVDAPNWDFTFSDIATDLEAICKAYFYFDDPIYGVPEMKIEVHRYRVVGGDTFLASQGELSIGIPVTGNLSVI